MMSSYINFLIEGQTFCTCCLSRNVKLIKLETCTHQKIFNAILDLKFLNINKIMVCYICHNILKAIEKFKKQCKEAFKHLSSSNISSEPEITKYINLSINKRHQTNSLNINTKFIDLESMDKIDPTILATNILEKEIPSFVEIKIENDMDYQEDISTIDDIIIQTPSPIISIDKIKDEVVPTSTTSQTKIIAKTKPDKIKSSMQEKTSCTIKTKSIDKKIKEKRTKNKKFDNIVKPFMLSEQEMLDERENAMKKLLASKSLHKCKHCLISFEHEAFLNKHNKRRHDEQIGPYSCDICKMRSKTKINNYMHIYRHYKRFACTQCELTSSTFYTIVRHFDKLHNKGVVTRLNECAKCDFSTTNYNQYRYHLKTHGNTTCDLCNHKFVTRDSLAEHKLYMHSAKLISFDCEKCDKTYKSRPGLNEHVKTAHRKRGVHYCAPCNASFKSDFILKHHLRTHRNHVQDADKIYKCSMCDKKYVEKIHLNNHIKWAHEKKINFQCDLCKKNFVRKNVLVKHMKGVHMKVEQPRDKICQFCGKGFTTINILRGHINTHMKERPWKCTMCKADFKQRAALYTHCKLVHKVLYKNRK